MGDRVTDALPEPVTLEVEAPLREDVGGADRDTEEDAVGEDEPDAEEDALPL